MLEFAIAFMVSALGQVLPACEHEDGPYWGGSACVFDDGAAAWVAWPPTPDDVRAGREQGASLVDWSGYAGR